MKNSLPKFPLIKSCEKHFMCFESFFDALFDHATNKDVISVTCEEFSKIGDDKQVERHIKNDNPVKLCPILFKILQELKEYL